MKKKEFNRALSLIKGHSDMYKRLFTLFFIFALSLMQFGYAQEVSHYATIVETLDATTDYQSEFDQVKVLVEKPLHIRVSPSIMQGDVPIVIDEELKRALVRSVLRAFIHTDIDRIKVTVQPELIESLNPHQSRILNTPTYSVDISRSKAQEVLKRLLGIDDFKLLVGRNLGGAYMADFWSPDIEHIFYNDQQAPGLNVFFKELGAK